MMLTAAESSSNLFRAFLKENKYLEEILSKNFGTRGRKFCLAHPPSSIITRDQREIKIWRKTKERATDKETEREKVKSKWQFLQKVTLQKQRLMVRGHVLRVDKMEFLSSRLRHKPIVGKDGPTVSYFIMLQRWVSLNSLKSAPLSR